MSERQQMEKQFATPVALGVLLIGAGFLSVGIYEFVGRWPAGYNGLEAGLFVTGGLLVLGYALIVRVKTRRGTERP